MRGVGDESCSVPAHWFEFFYSRFAPDSSCRAPLNAKQTEGREVLEPVVILLPGYHRLAEFSPSVITLLIPCIEKPTRCYRVYFAH